MASPSRQGYTPVYGRYPVVAGAKEGKKADKNFFLVSAQSPGGSGQLDLLVSLGPASACQSSPDQARPLLARRTS